jgi:hypothetical protein
MMEAIQNDGIDSGFGFHVEHQSGTPFCMEYEVLIFKNFI